jgi:ribosomal subunit interface protein
LFDPIIFIEKKGCKIQEIKEVFMMKSFIKPDEFIKIEESIKKLLPNLSNLDVSVDEDSAHRFNAKIQLSVPHKKMLVAMKQSDDPHVALDKAHQAIKKQIRKLKAKSFKQRKAEVELFDLAA